MKDTRDSFEPIRMRVLYVKREAVVCLESKTCTMFFLGYLEGRLIKVRSIPISESESTITLIELEHGHVDSTRSIGLADSCSESSKGRILHRISEESLCVMKD